MFLIKKNVIETRRGNQEWTVQSHWHTRHRKKTNKTKNKKPHTHTTLKRWATRTHQKTGVNPRVREEYAFPASYKTPAMLLIYSQYVLDTTIRKQTQIKEPPSA